MKILSTTLACLVATLAIAALAQAEETKHIKLVLQTDPAAGAVTIETGDLALGETRSFTSEKGRPVLLTRTEQGFEIDVDGKKTVVDLPPAGGDGFEFETTEEMEGESAGGEKQVQRRVIVHRLGDGAAVQVHGEGSPHIAIHRGDPAGAGREVRIVHLGEGHGKAGEAVHLVMGGDGQFAAARAQLLASGALDGLEPAARQKILAALGGEKAVSLPAPAPAD